MATDVTTTKVQHQIIPDDSYITIDEADRILTEATPPNDLVGNRTGTIFGNKTTDSPSLYMAELIKSAQIAIESDNYALLAGPYTIRQKPEDTPLNDPLLIRNNMISLLQASLKDDDLFNHVLDGDAPFNCEGALDVAFAMTVFGAKIDIPKDLNPETSRDEAVKCISSTEDVDRALVAYQGVREANNFLSRRQQASLVR